MMRTVALCLLALALAAADQALGASITFGSDGEAPISLIKESDALTCSGKFEAADVGVDGSTKTLSEALAEVDTLQTEVAELKEGLAALQSALSQVNASTAVVSGGAPHRYWRVRFNDPSPSAGSHAWTMTCELEYVEMLDGAVESKLVHIDDDLAIVYQPNTATIPPATLASLPESGMINIGSRAPAAYDGVEHQHHTQCSGTGSAENGKFAMGLDFGTPIRIAEATAFGPTNANMHANYKTDIYLEYSDDEVTWTAVSVQRGVGTNAGTADYSEVVKLINPGNI